MEETPIFASLVEKHFGAIWLIRKTALFYIDIVVESFSHSYILWLQELWSVRCGRYLPDARVDQKIAKSVT